MHGLFLVITLNQDSVKCQHPTIMSIKMCQFLLLITLLISISPVYSLIATNKEIMTGKVPYMCAFFRPKDYAIDDLPMPEILTFCSCTIISNNWAITARLCFVQLDWYLSPINTTFTNNLPAELHTIEKIKDLLELTLVKFQPNYKGNLPECSNSDLQNIQNCYLYGFSTPDTEPVQGSENDLIYKVWHMEGDLLRAEVSVMNNEACIKKHGYYLSEYKLIDYTTMCIDALPDNDLEPCSFDRGAPIFCNNTLQGILVYQRPLPESVPLHLPTGCYGNINTTYSIYAETIIPSYWNIIKKIILKSM